MFPSIEQHVTHTEHVVVLPDPFCPSKDRIWPSYKSRDKLVTALTLLSSEGSPNTLLNFLICTNGYPETLNFSKNLGSFDSSASMALARKIKKSLVVKTVKPKIQIWIASNLLPIRATSLQLFSQHLLSLETNICTETETKTAYQCRILQEKH